MRTMEDLIAHESMLDALDAALADGERLIVLKGPAGVGKTTLARAWLHARGEACPFVTLADRRSAQDLALELGRALSLDQNVTEPDALLESLAVRLEGRELVVVLDEIESLDRDALRLLGRCCDAGLRVVATSRARLRLRRERIIDVRPLAVPRPGHEVTLSSAAVALFVARRRRKGGLERIDEAALEDIGAIVRRLEGLPLAIVLAASRAATIPLARLRAEIERSVVSVGENDLDAPNGHRTLESAVESSFVALEPRLAALLVHACMLGDSFELDELEGFATCAPSDHEGHDDVASGLVRLVDLSLVTMVTDRNATEVSYGVHAVVRELALARADRAALEPKHARWQAARAAALARTVGPDSHRRLARAETGMLSAWRWCWAHRSDGAEAARAADLAIALGHLAELVGPTPALVEVPVTTAALRTDARVSAARRAAVLFYRGFAHFALGEFDLARTLYREVLATNDASAEISALVWCQLAWIDSRTSLDEAERSVQRGLAAIEGHVAQATETRLVSLRAQFDLRRGRLAAARRGFERALALAVAIGDASNEASALTFLGSVAFDEGALEESLRCSDRAVEVATRGPARIMGAIARGYRAITLHHLRREAAKTAYLDALRSVRLVRSPRFELLFGSWYAVWLAEHEEEEEASRRLDRIDASGDATSSAICAVHRAHLDLARADRARAAARADEEARAVALACRRLDDGAADGVDALREKRMAIAYLRGALLARGERTNAAGRDDSLAIGLDGRWVVLGGTVLDLGKQRILARLLWTLGVWRVLEPGRNIDAKTMVAAVWRGERIHPGAAKHRLRVAVSKLRALGLRDALVSEGDGYHLSDARTVQLVTCEQPRARAPSRARAKPSSSSSRQGSNGSRASTWNDSGESSTQLSSSERTASSRKGR